MRRPFPRVDAGTTVKPRPADSGPGKVSPTLLTTGEKLRKLRVSRAMLSKTVSGNMEAESCNAGR